MTVRWFREDENGDNRVQLAENSSSLHLTNVTIKDLEPYYWCMALEGQLCVYTLVFNLAPKRQYLALSVGEEVVLPCFNHDDLNGTETRWESSLFEDIRWDSNHLTSGEKQMYVTDGRTSGNYHLVVRSLVLNHSGAYACSEKLQGTYRYIKRYSLLVFPKSEPLTEFFSEGKEVVLNCNSNLTKFDRVVWYRRTAQVDDVILDTRLQLANLPKDLVGRMNASHPPSFLALSNLSLADSGEYWCAVFYERVCVSVTKTFLLVWDPFGIDSTLYRVYSSLMGCALLGMVCAVITVNLKTRRRRDQASLKTRRTAAQTQGQWSRYVSSSLGNMEVGLQQHLNRLDEIFATQGDYVQALRFMGQMADNIIRQLTAMPDLSKAKVDLSAIADQTAYVEYYRWLTYLLLLILDLVICLVACLGVAKQSRWLLTMIMVFGVISLVLSWASLAAGTATAVGTSDFCVSPDKFIANRTKEFLSAVSPNPFQQSLTIFQRSLTTMQIQIQGLLQFSVPVFPTAERDLLGIQRLLNSTEFNMHQLTALLDCRGLHKNYLDGLMGVCYDGVEGLLYLCLFSLLSVSAFCAILCAIPRAWTLIASRDRDNDDIDEEDPFNPQARHMAYNPSRASHVHSFCSYSSSLDSQASLHPPPQTAAILPTSEYMNQSMLFGGNPRYENVPLIGRGSPPPSYSPRMRTTYLSMTDTQIRHFGTDFQQV
ncbi:hypothetical protein J4Q44_G00180920 [Coregonus suidteri]|uniref:Protein tweety homolog n=1 Tax=Coregonus suidteri TaxID=861788 RepID=A0AAN8LK84_9TELE